MYNPPSIVKMEESCVTEILAFYMGGSKNGETRVINMDKPTPMETVVLEDGSEEYYCLNYFTKDGYVMPFLVDSILIESPAYDRIVGKHGLRFW